MATLCRQIQRPQRSCLPKSPRTEVVVLQMVLDIGIIRPVSEAVPRTFADITNDPSQSGPVEGPSVTGEAPMDIEEPEAQHSTNDRTQRPNFSGNVLQTLCSAPYEGKKFLSYPVMLLRMRKCCLTLKKWWIWRSAVALIMNAEHLGG